MMKRITLWIALLGLLTAPLAAVDLTVSGASTSDDTDTDFGLGSADINTTLSGTGSPAMVILTKNTNWRLSNSTGQPTTGFGNSICTVYIPELNATMLYRTNETWFYNSSNNTFWRHYPAYSPIVLTYPALAYDPYAKVVVLFGGRDSAWVYQSRTFVFNITTMNWADVSGATRPSARYAHSMAYCGQNASNGSIILYGGYAAPIPTDTWGYNATTNTWTNLLALTPPSIRYMHHMMFDAVSNRLILYGGYDLITWTIIGDTWAFNFETRTWSNLAPVSAPPGLEAGVMVYSTSLKCILLYGGYQTGFTYLTDTWMYNGSANSWSRMSLTSTYQGYAYAGGAYDIKNNITIFFRMWTPFTYVLGELYPDDGRFTSRGIDSGNTGLSVDWLNITWTGNFVNGSVKFQIASNNDNSSWSFIGPDGTGASFFTFSGQLLPKISDGDRYIRYRFWITSYSPFITPSVDKVTVFFNHQPNAPQLKGPQHDGYLNTTTPSFTLTASDFNLDTMKLDLEVSSDGFNTITAFDQTVSNTGWSASSYGSGSNAIFTMPGGTLSSATTYEWRVRAHDGIRWGDYSTAWKFTVDTTAPLVPDVVSDGGAVDRDYHGDTARINASWSEAFDFESGIFKYWVGLGTTSGASDIVGWSDAGKFTNFSFSGLSLMQGIKYYTGVMAENRAHLNSTPVSSDGFTIDTTPPSTPVVDDKMTFTNNPNVLAASWTSGEDASVIVEYAYAVGTTPGGTDAWPWTGVGLALQVRNTNLVLEDGKKYFVSVRALNIVGLWSVAGASDGVTIDVSLPAVIEVTANNDSAYTNSNNIRVDVLATDSISGIAKVQLSNDGVVWSDWNDPGAPLEWTLNGSDGTKTVYARGKDIAGNVGPASQDTIILDTTPPTVQTVTVREGKYSSATPVHITVIATDASEVVTIALGLAMNALGAELDYLVDASYQLIPGADGEQTIYVRVTDIAGNSITVMGANFTQDTVSPEIKKLTVNGDRTYATNPLISCSLDGTDATSGIARMTVTADGVIVLESDYRSLFEVNLGEKEGSRIIGVTITDRAGNRASSDRTVILDTTAPLITALSADVEFTAAPAFNITVSARDAVTSVVEMMVDAGTGGGFVPFKNTTAITIPSGDGEHVIKVWVKDAAGLLSNVREVKVILDTTAPTDISLRINDGASMTTKREVTLRLSAYDALSGVDSYSLLGSGAGWSDYKPFTEFVNYTLPDSAGPRDIYLKVRDRVGNEAQTKSSILLKLSDPVISVSNPAEGKKLSGKVRIDGRVNSSLQIDAVELRVDGGAWVTLDGKETWTYNLDTTQLSDGTHSITVRAKTAAGYSPEKTAIYKSKNKPDPVTVDQLSGIFGGIAVAAILGVVGVALAVYAMSRKKKEEPPAADTFPEGKETPPGH